MSTSFTVPESVRSAARHGLELRRKYGRGGLDAKQAHAQGIGSGVQRAANLASGSVSAATVRRMHAFFARHSAFKKFHADKTSAAYISWLLWGGNAGKRWADAQVRKMDRATAKSMSADLNEGLAQALQDWRDREADANMVICACADCSSAQDQLEDWDSPEDK